MRLRKVLGLAAVVVAVTVGAGPLHADSGVSLDKLLSDIQRTLIKVRDTSDISSLLRLETVKLNLRGTVAYNAEGKATLFIVDLGGGGSESSAQEIDLTLEPPRPGDRSRVSGSTAPLADAIIDAARDVKQAASREPPLHLKELSATISFTVEKSADVSAGLKILPVTAEIGGKLKREDVQKITIVFLPK
jgi:hypothetical protein